MYRIDMKDLFCIILKSIFIAIIFVPLFIGMYKLIHLNINFAYYISDKFNIPRDYTIGIAGAGFANNIIILMSAFEIGIIIYILKKLSNTKLYSYIKEYIKIF